MTEGELRVEALGSLRAWHGEQELDLGPGRQRAVFVTLVARAVTQPVTRPELIQAVWGDAAPASADGSVHTYISGLRRALEPNRARWSTDGVLVSSPAGYRLRLAQGALDVHVFDKLREKARALRQAGDAAGAVETLDAALALWRGEALSGVPGPFAEAQRARLAEHRLLALEQRAADLLTLGSHEDLVAELSVLVREYPLRESLWQSLMIALHRGGRSAEALDAFQHAREVLREELGVVPGVEIAKVHQRILTNDPSLAAPSGRRTSRELLSVLPGPVAHRLDHQARTCHGREAEIARLRRLLDELLSGRGRAVWIEGEPGIGKSELLAVALADAGGRGCHVAWASAGELSQRFPLQVILECLGSDTHGHRMRPSGDDPVATTVDRLLAHIDELCATAPLVLVLDNLHWADEPSVLMWNRLSAATRQLPLLLVAATRPAPGRPSIAQVRRAAEARDLELLMLGPLDSGAVESLVGDLIGARPGENMHQLMSKAAGNPLYLREVISSLVHRKAFEITEGRANLREDAVHEAPTSLLAAVTRTLDLLSAPARETLRRAAILGTEFAVTQVAATMGKPPSHLVEALDEALDTRIILDAGDRLAFRHPTLRWALCLEIPEAELSRWHRGAAEALARMGAGVEQVAQHLVAVPAAVDDWVLSWLAEHQETLSNRAPLIAAELLRQVLDACPGSDPRREELLVAHVLVLDRLDQEPEELAKEAMLVSKDPNRVAEMRHIAAAMMHRRGATEAAVELLEHNNSPATPVLWQERRRSLLANFRRGSLDDLGRAARRARQTYRAALIAGEPYPIGHALQTLWLVKTIERDHASALRHIDRAIAAVEGHAEHLGLYFDLLDNRVFSLHNLDQLEEAHHTLRTARETAARHSRPHGLQVSSAVQDYWAGRWDEALVELDTVTEDGPAITFHGLREPGPAALLLHGVAALICGRSGNTDEAAAHLFAADERPPVTDAERESCDFLLVARSLHAERSGDPDTAIDLLAPVLDTTYAPMMLRHQWLPGLARLAREHGRPSITARALAVCEEEAAKEKVPARANAAALWCSALESGDPEPLLTAAERYRKVGRWMEKATALGDAAVLLAEHGRRSEAQLCLDEAATDLDELGALWDVRRIENRMREFGLTRSLPEPARTARGWSALSALESQIAQLVAAGHSNPEIARRLSLPRRTVQAHVTRILGKLGLAARIGIADQASDLSFMSTARLRESSPPKSEYRH